MQFRCCALILIATLASSPAFAKKDVEDPFKPDPICNEYLTNPRYAVTRFLDKNAPAWTFRPEAGSIEAIHPGTIAEIHSILYYALREFKNRKRDLATSDIVYLIENVMRRLVSVRDRHPEPRLYIMIDRVLNFMSGVQQRAGTTALPNIRADVMSKLWELTMACFFAGERIYLGNLVSELFPDEFKKETDFNRRGWGREIDIAVKGRNGTWRWIEVKNWGLNESLREERKVRLQLQGAGVKQARDLLPGQKIETWLLMKFGLPVCDRAVYQNCHYDKLYFAYPSGTEHAED